MRSLKHVVFGVLLVFMFACANQGSGKVAPDFAVTDLSGNSVKLSDFRGKTVLVNFWTTWCPYCVEEMPSIQQLSQDYPDLVILAISNEEISTLVDFQKREGLTFPILRDSGAASFDAYEVTGIPRTFVIGPDGKILRRESGSVDWQSDAMRNVAASLFGKR